MIYDRNVPETLQQQMNADLLFIDSVQGAQSSPLHQEIYGPLHGESYNKFINLRIKSIGLSDCGNPNSVACFVPMLGLSKIWMTPNYVKFSHPQIARLMVVFHEARHTEIITNGSLDWKHATCPKVFNDKTGQPLRSIFTGAVLAGEAACDKTAYGAYGISLILLKNISKFCTNCNEKVKMDAGIYADDQLNRIISAKAVETIADDLYGGKH